MLRLKHLTIRDFQVHSKLDMELDPYVTTIIGGSDVGKSSIVRAIKWLCLNQPSGDSFITHGKQRALVLLRVDNHTLTRKRGKTSNSYTLDGETYSALGQGGIPDPVKQLLNLDTINFQTQHEPHFWFTLPPGEVSRELNSIINLTLIDSTMSNLATELRRSRSIVQVSESRLQKAQTRRDELAWVEQADEDLTDLETSKTKLIELQHDKGILEQVVERIQTKQQKLDQLAKVCRDGMRLVTYGKAYQGHTDRASRLRGLVWRITAEDQQIRQRIPPGALDALQAKLGALQGIVAKRERLAELLDYGRDKEEEVCQRKMSLTKAESDLANQTGGICPLCGSPIPS